LENGQVVDQNLHPALELIASQPRLFQGQGSVVAGWRRYRGRRLGPYYRLVYRHRGRQCSVYLGRSGELAERVRAALKQLQAPLRRFREFARVRARIKASLRRERAWLDAELRKSGLYLKGFEPRGWRQLVATLREGPRDDGRAVGFRFPGWPGNRLGKKG